MSPVFLITGNVASGKSTVARAVLERFELGVHIDLDQLREMVVSGLADPLRWTEETSRQFQLALESAARMAEVYHDAGFAVAVEGTVDAAALLAVFTDRLTEGVLVPVCLTVSAETAHARNEARSTKPFDTSILREVIDRLDSEFETPAGFTLLDNDDLSAEEAATAIVQLQRSSTERGRPTGSGKS